MLHRIGNIAAQISVPVSEIPGAVCGIEEFAKTCVRELATDLGSMPAVRDAFESAAGNSAVTIEGMATKILYDVLPSACKILDDVGLFTSGPNLSKLFLSLQSIMNMMNDLKAMPFVGKYIPSISAKCQEVFLNFTTRVILDGSTEKIPQMVCSTTSIETHMRQRT